MNDRELRQGLAHLQAMILPQLPAEGHAGSRYGHPSLEHLVNSLYVYLGIITPVNARRRSVIHRTGDALVCLLSQEGHIGR